MQIARSPLAFLLAFVLAAASVFGVAQCRSFVHDGQVDFVELRAELATRAADARDIAMVLEVGDPSAAQKLRDVASFLELIVNGTTDEPRSILEAAIDVTETLLPYFNDDPTVQAYVRGAIAVLRIYLRDVERSLAAGDGSDEVSLGDDVHAFNAAA